ncbi:MAG: glycosyltransferase family 4 protein [Candidatus Omnitrophica bacterium]|nr:glycosyltransferase family 4 protein [Candidatus Omnitrophota bacterium]
MANKIIFITSSYLPVIGGLQNFLSQLVGEFQKNGSEVRVITHKYPRLLKSQEAVLGARTFRCLFFDPANFKFNFRSFLVNLGVLILSPINFFRFYRWVKDFNPEIINYHFVGSPTFFILILLKIKKIKLITSLHGDDVRTLAYRSKMSMLLFKKIIKKSNVITVNSKNTLKDLKKIITLTGKEKIIYNGINLEQLRTQESFSAPRKYIFSLGRFVKKKGFNILIESFLKVIEKRDDVDLILAGDGPERNDLEALAKESKALGRITFLGWVGQTKAIEYLKGCEIFVLPSFYEPFGLVLLEAMFCQKPIIATKSGGPQELIVNNENGLLIEIDDKNSLIKAIFELLDNRELKDKIIANLKIYPEEFTIKSAAIKYSLIFKETYGEK